MNYEQFAQKTRSVKSILAHVRAKQKVKIMTLDAGANADGIVTIKCEGEAP